MRYWRMAFREGSQGPSLWELCRKNGVAAISYYDIDHVDLAKYPGKKEPRRLWNRLSSSQQASLFKIANVMEEDDIIYVKEGKEIVGCGTVTGSYEYAKSKKIIDSRGHLWPHQVPVRWDRSFKPLPIMLGAELYTILELTEERLRLLVLGSEQLKAETSQLAEEGQLLKRTIRFRERNRNIILKKKRASPPFCEACGMSFRGEYGNGVNNCLEVHHKNPMAERKGVIVTRIQDLVVICPNCHSVVHSFEPPLDIRIVADMRRRARRQERRK